MTSPRRAEGTAVRLRKHADTLRDECWHWTGQIARDGYGRLSVDGRKQMAHRLAYEVWVGPIAVGLEIDHLCRVKTCINPAHLEAVTRAENMHRQPRIAARMAQTHCKRGHEFTASNTRIDSRGCRNCKTCHNERERARKALRRMERSAS